MGAGVVRWRLGLPVRNPGARLLPDAAAVLLLRAAAVLLLPPAAAAPACADTAQLLLMQPRLGHHSQQMCRGMHARMLITEVHGGEMRKTAHQLADVIGCMKVSTVLDTGLPTHRQPCGPAHSVHSIA